MGLQADLGVQKVSAIAKPGECGSMDVMTLGTQQPGQRLPAPAAMPAAVDENERGQALAYSAARLSAACCDGQ